MWKNLKIFTKKRMFNLRKNIQNYFESSKNLNKLCFVYVP